jgi:hypothetical protein
MRVVSFLGFITVLLVAFPSTAELPSVQQASDGGLYLISAHPWIGDVESINGCQLSPITTSAILTWREGEQLYRSQNLRNLLATGTSILRNGQERLSVSNNRTIAIGEMNIVTFLSGAREVQVQYELPVLEQQVLRWTFRRPDGSIALSQGNDAYRISFNLKATAHIAIPVSMNAAGGTMEFVTTPDPFDLYSSCPAARDQSTKTIAVPPVVPPVTAIVNFDPANPDDGQILISKALWDVGYPSALQLLSSAAGHAEIRIAGTRRDAITLQPRPGTVYLRVADPPDTAAYRGADAHDGDNDGPPATIDGALSTAVQTDAQGRFEATLVATSQVAGDNYQVVASVDPTFNCGNVCRRTPVFTMWKRIYVEEQRMFRRGTFLNDVAEAGKNRIPIEDPAPFVGLAPGEMLRLVHAGSQSGEGFYSDTVVFQSIQRELNSRWWYITTAPDSPVPRRYGVAPPSDTQQNPLLDVTRDGVGVVSAGSYEAERSAADELLKSMFVELKPLSGAVTEVPHIAELILGPPMTYYANHWLQQGVRTSEWGSRPDPNVFHRIAAARVPLVRVNGKCRGAQLGVTTVGGGGNYSYILSERIEDVTAGLPDSTPDCPPVGAEYLNAPVSRVNGEITAHETAHFWIRTARQPDMDGQGHCQRSRYADATNCLMHTPYAGPELYDGQVLLHYDLHGAHSEYMWIRRDPDPVPLQ